MIKKYGAKNYNFHQYRAHYHGIIRKVDKTYNPFYEPPGYHADIASGVYQPDSQKPQVKLLLSITFFSMGRILLRILFARLVYYKHITAINNYTTQDEMPPDYLLERRNASKVLMAVEEKYLRQLRRVEDIKVLLEPLPLHVFFSQGEHWYGRLGPCSPLRLPLAGTKLG